MRFYISIPILAVLVALQATLLTQFRIFNGQPDLVLLVVLSWAVHAELDEGLFWALVGGLMVDLLSVMPLGVSAVGLVVMVYAINTLARQLYRVNILLLIGFVFAGTLLQHLISVVILAAIGYGTDLINGVQYVLLPELFYNLALFLPVYWVTRLIQRRVPQPGTRIQV